CFLLVYGYSMVVVYRAGKLPLRLRPFTEDRMLGLKPFGAVSLRLASVYAVIPIVFAVLATVNATSSPNGVAIILSTWRPGDFVLVASLVVIGVGLFFLPLLSIHRQLVDAKHRELEWINPQYSDVIKRMKLVGSGERGGLADELSMV